MPWLALGRRSMRSHSGGGPIVNVAPIGSAQGMLLKNSAHRAPTTRTTRPPRRQGVRRSSSACATRPATVRSLSPTRFQPPCPPHVSSIHQPLSKTSAAPGRSESPPPEKVSVYVAATTSALPTYRSCLVIEAQTHGGMAENQQLSAAASLEDRIIRKGQ